ncbi:MAG: GxxExxY protein [Parcubacteria group bacterium]|nr:GxxExxY protein [Parcubacteria group bacterium]
MYELTNNKAQHRIYKKDGLVYPELSYEIIGAVLDVKNEIGLGHKEHFYQKATAKSLKQRGLEVREQLPAKIYYHKEYLGIYYLDFLVENKIIVEIKAKSYFAKNDIEQLFRYLKIKDLKLGILVHFTKSGVRFKRIVNIR